MVAVGLLTAAAGSAQAAPISEIKANFVGGEYATHYTVDVTGLGPNFTAKWHLSLECVDPGCPDPDGTLADPKPNVDPGCKNNNVLSTQQNLTTGQKPEFVWHHPSAADQPSWPTPCDHAREGPRGHQGEITVTVSDANTTCTASYKGTKTSTGTSISDGTASPPDCHPNTATTPGSCELRLAKHIIDYSEVSPTIGHPLPYVHRIGPNEFAVAEGVEIQFLIVVDETGPCDAIDLRDPLPLEFEARSANTNTPFGFVYPTALETLSNGSQQAHAELPAVKADQHEQTHLHIYGKFSGVGDRFNQARADPNGVLSNKIRIHVVTQEKVTRLKASAKQVSGQVKEVKVKKDSVESSRSGPWHAPLEAALPPPTASRPLSGPGAGNGCGRREDGPREGQEAVQGPLTLPRPPTPT